jgi:AcrR family transcriptional regulator
MPGRADAGDTRERIKAVALDLFRDQGSEKTSLREIAERLQFTKAALYYYFRTKDELVAELAAPFMDGFANLLDEAQRDDADVSRLLVEGYLDLLLDQRALVRWLRDDVSARLHPSIGNRLADLNERFHVLLGGANMTFDEQVSVTAALGALGAGVSNFPDADSAQLRDPLLRAAWAVLHQDPETEAGNLLDGR